MIASTKSKLPTANPHRQPPRPHTDAQSDRDFASMEPLPLYCRIHEESPIEATPLWHNGDTSTRRTPRDPCQTHAGSLHGGGYCIIPTGNGSRPSRNAPWGVARVTPAIARLVMARRENGRRYVTGKTGLKPSADPQVRAIPQPPHDIPLSSPDRVLFPGSLSARAPAIEIPGHLGHGDG